MEIVKVDGPLTGTTVDDIIKWIREHEQNGNIDRMAVVFEDKDRKVYSQNINLRNRDYAYFLMQEMFGLMIGDDNG